ncbi:MAG: hypothetical protein LBB56_07615 [Chitinispirillales bacterium]|jgi:hypothetical protein|nr:hypothetical protein [Chitinispirillales bacterium]
MVKINFINPSVSQQGGGGSNKKPAVRFMPAAVIALIGLLGYGVYYMVSTDMFSDIIAGFYEGSNDDSRFTKVTDVGGSNSGDKPPTSAEAGFADDGDNNKAAAVDTKAVVKLEEKPAAPPIAKEVPVSKPAAAPEPAPQPAVAAVPVSEPPAAPEPAPKAQTQSPKPSSLVRTHMIENVVRELGNESRAVKKFDAAYEDMSAVEKINYEVLFSRNAFEFITRSVPPGVKLRTIEIEDFRTVYTSGVSPSREMVEELFSAFRRERGELLPKPLSHIKDEIGGSGFQFVITAKPRFGLELDDPFQALDHLGFKESLTANLRNFSRMAAGNNFKMRAAPSQISADKAGSYRRVVYKAEGESTYRDFHKFVLALYDEKVPCAFKKITLTAKNGDVVSVSAEILFTVKE